jgi:uncharacterized protein (TIGR02246 family)
MRISWLVIALLALNTSVSGAAPPATNAAGLQETLQDRLTYVYGPVWATGDPAKFVEEILTHDAVITAADGPKVWRGRTQSLDLVKELLKAYSAITPKAVYTKSLGPNAALQFVVFEVTANDAAHTKSTAKSLYVWVKTASGWRVTADHYSYVGMDTP